MIFLVCMYIVSKYTNKKIANVIIVICLILQLIDLYPSLNNKFDYKEKTYNIDTVQWENVLNNVEHIVYLNLENNSFDEIRSSYYKIAYIAYINDCTLNDFYFARKIENVETTAQNYVIELINGNTENNCIYVINQEDDNIWWNKDLISNNIDGFIVIVP